MPGSDLSKETIVHIHYLQEVQHVGSIGGAVVDAEMVAPVW